MHVKNCTYKALFHTTIGFHYDCDFYSRYLPLSVDLIYRVTVRRRDLTAATLALATLCRGGDYRLVTRGADAR
jgi:hypothetical protein